MQGKTEPKDAAGQAEYMAFISYRHADNHEDGRKWADWLHHFLETYEIPADLVGQLNHYQQPIPSQIYPVFQDEKELSVDADLSASIRRALDRTQTLIVLCSPQSVRSRYVEEEIAYFKKLGRANRIIAVILYGRPGGQEDGDPDQQECFPLPLRYEINEDGTLVRDQLAAEHLAADVRTSEQTQGYTTPHAYRAALESQRKYSRSQVQAMTNAYKERLELAKLKIIAGILGVSLADLTKRDKAYQLQKAQKRQKQIKRIAIGFAILFLLAVVSGIYAWRQQKETQRTFAQSLFNIGVERMESRKEDEGAAYLAAACRLGNRDALSYAHSLLGNLSEKLLTFPDTAKATDIVFSPDGRFTALLFKQPGGGKVEVHDAMSMRLLHTFSREKEQWFDMAFSSDGKKLFGLLSKGVYGWDLATGKPAGPSIARDSSAVFTDFSVSPSGRYLLLGNMQGRYWIYDAQTGQPTGIGWQQDAISQQAVFFNNEQLVASCITNKDSTIEIRHVTDTLVPPRRLALNDRISKLKPGPSPEQLIAITAAQVFILDAVQGSVLDTLRMPFVSDVRFNPGRRSIALLHSLKSRVVDRITHQTLQELPSPGFQLSTVLSPSPDGIHYKRMTRLMAAQEPGYRQITLPPFYENTDFFVLSPDNKRVYTLSENDSAVKVWDAQRGAPVKAAIRQGDTLNFLSMTRNGQLLLTGSVNGQVQLWDANSGQPAGAPFRHEGSVVFAQDNREHTVLLAVYKEKLVRLWSIKDRKPIGKPLQLDDPVNRAQLSYNGRYAAIATTKGLFRIWDTEKQQYITPPQTYPSPVIACHFSPDNRLAAVALRNGLVEVMNAATGANVLRFTVQTERGIIRFSPDSKRLIVMANTNEVQVREIKTGLQTGDAMFHAEPIREVAFSPDGKRVLTIAGHHLRLWNPENGKPVADDIDYLQYGTPANARFSADSKRMLVAAIVRGRMLLLSVWETPGLLDMPANVLAAGVEALFGKKYNIERGILETVDQQRTWDSLQAANSRSWYFQDRLVRAASPASGLALPALLSSRIPLLNEQDAQVLENAYPFHPLSRAALAEYYSRRGETGFWAEDLIRMVQLQLPAVKDPALRKKVEQWLRRATTNIQQLERNGI